MIKIVKQYKNYIRTIQTEIYCPVIIVLVVLFTKILYLNSQKEIFSHGYDLGVFIDNVCYSVVASFIFYIFMHIKSEKDKENIRPFVSRYITEIHSDCIKQFKNLGLELSSDINPVGIGSNMDGLTLDKIESLFLTINPTSQITTIYNGEVFSYFGRYFTYIEFMNYYRIQTINKIKEMFEQIVYLDPQLIGILSEVRNCCHFRVIEGCNSIYISNSDMSVFSASFFQYCLLMRKLNEYARNNIY